MGAREIPNYGKVYEYPDVERDDGYIQKTMAEQWVKYREMMEKAQQEMEKPTKDWRAPYNPPDGVEAPAHYKLGDLQTIDFIHRVCATLTDPFLAYCIGNVLKYSTRAGRKGKPAEDYRKAIRYLQWCVEHVEKGKISHE